MSEREIVLKASSGSSKIIVGWQAKPSQELLQASSVSIVTDEFLAKTYADYLTQITTTKPIIVPSGEAAKNLEEVQKLYQEFFRRELDRDALVIAFGGGAVCDLVGFAASTYLRGLKVGYIPTTLLAQVDASVGGKAGVNFEATKNLIGSIRQPDFCIIDPAFLKTLPKSEISSGFAECIKHAAIRDAELFEELTTKSGKLLNLEQDSLTEVIYKSVMIKASVVEADEREDGERRLLNFGHTFGHAIEVLDKVPHGYAVAQGMCIAAHISKKLGFSSKEDVIKLETLIKDFSLPVNTKCKQEDIFSFIVHDKKRYGTKIKMVLLKTIGEAFVHNLEISELKKVFDDLHISS